ncbi:MULTISPECIES: flagellar basal body rod protein FlgB [unclassified Paenibacillus]|uniref:flagellar basal body rod protein FlgB n=2 Tax=Paenibacillus TaxID=44249 RepID=UPI000953B44A|nr:MULTISPECIES: flagellar basal body rod protein FlgB [unclassified Paenibacillus]SIQ26273.1 flagellar basal-body rod protein FlgB [Paenibacillus sp. RU4X]SIQ48122.1 flagellar basal-body rod protein FlgB [Paenibacillus sp. RU4T]
MNVLNGADFSRLAGAMRAAEARQQVISDNISNADTPHFKRSELVFEELLNDQLNGQKNHDLAGIKTQKMHMDIGLNDQTPTMQLVTDEKSVMNNNGNNVDPDREMALLAKNQLRYNSYIQQINHEIKMMRTAIDGRG